MESLTETTSEFQAKGGVIISLFLLFPKYIFRALIVIKFALEPEFTKILYFVPSHLDHFFSNSKTFLEAVSLGFFFKNEIKTFLSFLSMLLDING